MPSLNISNYPSNTHNLGEQSNYSALPTVLAWFGWQDVSAKIKQAEADESGHSAQATEADTGIQVPSWARHLMQVANDNTTQTTNAYCFPTGSCSLPPLANGNSGFSFVGTNPGDYSGSSAGDVNGDGIDDWIVGSYAANGGIGQSFLLFGSKVASTWAPAQLSVSSFADGQRGVTFLGEGPTSQSGYTVAKAGDINGDGLADLFIGAPYARGAGTGYVIFGSNATNAWGNGTLTLANVSDGRRGVAFVGEAGNDFLSFSASGAKDVNGDGINDLIVGAPRSISYFGKIYVIFGSRNSSIWGNGTVPIISLADGVRGFVLQGPGPSNYAQIAYSLAAGDINGDGLSDIIVGAPLINLFQGAGGVYVVFGSNNGTAWGNGRLFLANFADGRRGFYIPGETLGDQLGYSVAANDVNADGVDDLIMGAPLANAGGGKGYTVFGTNASTLRNSTVALKPLLNGQQGFVLKGPATSNSGWTLSTGDLNGDGIPDLLIGAPYIYITSSPGRVYVTFGSEDPNAWGDGELSLDLLANGLNGFSLQGLPGDKAGLFLNNLGDINGDNVTDLFVGAPAVTGAVTPPAPTGNAYLIFGAAALPFNFTANQWTVGAGKTAQLGPNNLAIISTKPAINTSGLSFQTTNVDNGYFTLESNPSISVTSFGVSNVSSAQFVQVGGARQPKCRIFVSPPWAYLGAAVYSDTDINFLGFPPIVAVNQLTINQGQSVVLTGGNLGISDQDTSPSAITITISNLQHGTFIKTDPLNNTTQVVTTFTQQDLLNRNIQFRHDGSANPPSYGVNVDDGKTTVTQSAVIIFKYAPELNITGIEQVVDQGEPTTLDDQSFSATSRQTFSDNLVFEIGEATEGYFVYSNQQRINAFTQFALITGGVQFIHNGSNFDPNVTLRASDGVMTSDWESLLFKLNRKPRVLREASAQTVTQNSASSFTIQRDIFIDPDGNPLTITANQVGGTPLPFGLTINGNYFEANMPNPGAYLIELKATDPRGLSASSRFLLTVENSLLTEYRTLWQTLTAVGGIGLTVLAYLWLRRRIAQHRRDFSLANELRKVLNLEYYDFTRFDGDTFKSKMIEFISLLNYEYPKFYNELTHKELKSFAVCLAEILSNEGYVTRSGYGPAGFGIFCCLNVGWPTELNLKRIEKETPHLVDKTINSWKNQARYQLRHMKEKDSDFKECTIYVDVIDNKVHYLVASRGVEEGAPQQGTLDAKDVGCHTLPTNFTELMRYQPKIYHLLLEKGEVETNKAMVRWPHEARGAREKFLVFCCCKKPSSEGRFRRGDPLTKLEHYEAALYKTSNNLYVVNSESDEEIEMAVMEQKTAIPTSPVVRTGLFKSPLLGLELGISNKIKLLASYIQQPIAVIATCYKKHPESLEVLEKLSTYLQNIHSGFYPSITFEEAQMISLEKASCLRQAYQFIKMDELAADPLTVDKILKLSEPFQAILTQCAHVTDPALQLAAIKDQVGEFSPACN